MEITKWKPDRINNAFDYLREEKDILAVVMPGDYKGVKNFMVTAIFSDAISIVEDEKQFKRHFEISVGIPGVFKFSWGAKEK